MNAALPLAVLFGFAVYSRRASAGVQPDDHGPPAPRAYVPFESDYPAAGSAGAESRLPAYAGTGSYTPFEGDFPVWVASAPEIVPEAPFWPSHGASESDGTLADPEINVSAFLAVIRDAEGTSQGADPYRVVMGYGLELQDLSDHPLITGEWAGAAFGNGKWSTAAGAYQFLARTWQSLRDAGAVWDFSPESQDAGAVELIRRRGALGYIREGRIHSALQLLSWEWASLPPNRYGQGVRTEAWVIDRFQQYGGVIA